MGAVALALLAVIVLPMVFDQEPPPPSQVSVRIPAEDAAPAFKPAPSPKKEKTEEAKPAAKGEQFIVPVGAYTQPDGVVAKLKAARMPYYTEPLKGNVTRVRAGPFSSREAAQKALRELKGLGLEPGPVAARPG